MTAEEALTALKEGNRRFVENRPANPRRSPQRRSELPGGQRPFASVLGCSDSRVVPEIVFDQGLGDLFVVRVAGNVVDGAVLESLAFSTAHLRIPLIVVLGHSACGAVTAAVSGDPSGPAHAPAIMERLRPAVERARSEGGDALTRAVFANTRLAVETLRRALSRPAPHAGDEGPRIAGAVYDIGKGSVEWLED